MHIQFAIQHILGQLSATIALIEPAKFSQPCKNLSNATIGQHTRHIIEMFQCLLDGYEIRLVNYEKRPRCLQLETVPEAAIEKIQFIFSALSRPNVPLQLEAAYRDDSNESIILETNYYREIAYNLEHAIHHMALIKVGLLENADISLPEGFGIAPSTLKFRQSCAQ